MKRLILLALFLAVAAPARADGCPPISCGNTASASPGSRFLAVRPNGQFGPLVLYDLVARRYGRRLPAGLLSADGRSFVAAQPRGPSTEFTRFAVRAARVRDAGKLPGRYALAAISASGSRVVVADARQATGRTRLLVVDTSVWKIVRSVTLRGSYGVEALSPDGRRLYLIRYGRSGYALRLYDFATRKLAATPLAEGPSAFGKMVGTAWTSVATRDGRWLLTLYVKPDTGGGFIHALDLSKGVGHCIDLPAAPTDFASLAASTLTLSPDQRRLYIATPLLGRLIVFDVVQPRIVRKVRVELLRRAEARLDVDRAAAVSANGRMLAFGVDGRIWRYDTAYGLVKGPVRAGGRLAGAGFTPDGRSLVILRTDWQARVFEAAGSRRLG